MNDTGCHQIGLYRKIKITPILDVIKTTLKWYSPATRREDDYNHKSGPKHDEGDVKETERKAQVMMDQQHQQPPGEKELQPQRCIKNGIVKNTQNGRS